jgi:hypothetical protein
MQTCGHECSSYIIIHAPKLTLSRLSTAHDDNMKYKTKGTQENENIKDKGNSRN